MKHNKNFSTRLPCANKKTRGIKFSMVKTKYKTMEDTIKKQQSLRGETKVKVHQIMSKFYKETHYRTQSGYFQYEENPLSKNNQGLAKIKQEALLLMKLSWTKPQVKNMNTIHYGLCFITIGREIDIS